MRFFVLLFVVLVAAWSGSARAMPADDSIRRQQATSDEDVEDDLVADGDIDGEDRIALRQRGREGVARLADQSWVSLAGLERSLQSGKTDLAAILVVGIAFDRIATGQVHRIGEPPKQSAASARAPKSEEAGALSPTLAHDCVAAAYRSAGLGVDDARVDAMIARERASALLPETRVRAMRLWNDADHTTTLGTTDSTNYYDAVAANLVLEVRLTWRLDRWLYGSDEPTLERIRLERQDARSRLATRTLEALFAWQRADLDAREADSGSRTELEAILRLTQTEAMLDVLTGGWFSDHRPKTLGPAPAPSDSRSP